METKNAFPLKDGQERIFTRGGHIGLVVRVNEQYSYWAEKSFYMGDPKQGICTPEGWQIVIDVQDPEKPGTWLNFTRDTLANIEYWTDPVKD